jgi:CheY-like chemotaxis protein
MVVDDNNNRAILLKDELESNDYHVEIFLGRDNYKKASETIESCPIDSPYSIAIANERLGLISGGRTGLLGEYAESGLLFCHNLKKSYTSVVRATMVMAAIKGYSMSHGFYNVAALREVVHSLGISGYITKPINSKNIQLVVQKIERVIYQAAQEKPDALFSSSNISAAEWLTINAEFKTKRLFSLLDNYIRTLELIDSCISFYPYTKEVSSEMAQRLGQRIMKSVESIQQLISIIDREVLSEKRLLQYLFRTRISTKTTLDPMKQDHECASEKNSHDLIGGRRNYISNLYDHRISTTRFNSAMENLMRSSEYVACIKTELSDSIAPLIRDIVRDIPDIRSSTTAGTELEALEILYKGIIAIREHLKGSIILQENHMRIFNKGYLNPY